MAASTALAARQSAILDKIAELERLYALYERQNAIIDRLNALDIHSGPAATRQRPSDHSAASRNVSAPFLGSIKSQISLL